MLIQQTRRFSLVLAILAAPFLASAQEGTWFALSSKWGYYLTDGTWEGAVTATTGPEVEWMVLIAADGTPCIRTQATRINLTALPSGLYVLKIGVREGSPVVRMVLKQ